MLDLTLFVVFILLSIIIIALGLFRPEHTELSLVGFVFLFLLSMVILEGNIQYKVGEDINTTYNYSCIETCDQTGNTSLMLSSTTITNRDVYDTFTAGGTLSHLVGYWLAIASIIGFIGVLMSLKYQFKKGG